MLITMCIGLGIGGIVNSEKKKANVHNRSRQSDMNEELVRYV